MKNRLTSFYECGFGDIHSKPEMSEWNQNKQTKIEAASAHRSDWGTKG